ncbi:MAG TPA: basic secretory protein-like protein, partial [Kofleriaceae bacterium]|nr:basic secretory protein-like protein [Kofleriaceae bacterium]
SRSEIDLAWQDAGGAALYRIEQSTDGDSFTAVAYAPAGATGATIAGLPPGAARTFRVVAENAAGSSPPSATASATTRPPLAGTSNSDGSVRYSEGGYTLTMHNKDPGTPAVMMQRMIDEFFATYPAMAAAYNPGAATSVRVTFDPAYDGVAYASGSQIVVSSSWARQAADDVDVVAHEGFHVVQAYSNPDAPGWAVEGLADFARARYGNLNAGACWSMQRYQSGQSYTDAYGVTARFLLWIETSVRASITTELDDALRARQYSASFWTAKTGKTVDALWADYAADSAREPVDVR